MKANNMLLGGLVTALLGTGTTAHAGPRMSPEELVSQASGVYSTLQTGVPTYVEYRGKKVGGQKQKFSGTVNCQLFGDLLTDGGKGENVCVTFDTNLPETGGLKPVRVTGSEDPVYYISVEHPRLSDGSVNGNKVMKLLNRAHRIDMCDAFPAVRENGTSNGLGIASAYGVDNVYVNKVIGPNGRTSGVTLDAIGGDNFQLDSTYDPGNYRLKGIISTDQNGRIRRQGRADIVKQGGDQGDD